MNTRNTIVLAGLAVAGLVVNGCGKGESSEEAHDHDHDHDNGSHVEHVEEAGQEGGEEYDAHGEMRSIDDVVIAGTTLAVAISGELVGGVGLHVDINHKDGDVPAAVRLWVGDEDGTGAVKSKAEGSGSYFHGHVDVPAELADGVMLWIEIETADGERHKSSVVTN